MSTGIEKLRQKIDKIDSTIVEALCQRLALAQKIGIEKNEKNTPIFRPDREKEVYSHIFQILEKHPNTHLDAETLENIYREIIATSIRLEGPVKVAYLGPEASFSHIALQNRFREGAISLPFPSIPDVFQNTYSSKEIEYAIVPIDNSVEGSIGITLDSLLETDLQIYAEHYIKIQHHLLYYKELNPKDFHKIKRIYSLGIVQNQCREWLRKQLNYTKIKFVEVPSTAKAAQLASQNKDGAAIASALALKSYKLKSIASQIQDQANNKTRFIILAKKQAPPSQDNKTSIAFSLDDKVGALAQILSIFAKAKINLNKIESRSKRRKFGEYNFFIDFAGHQKDKKIAKILSKIKSYNSNLKILGSYPKESYYK